MFETKDKLVTLESLKYVKDDVAGDLAEEVTRATTAEGNNATNISSEVTRAKSAEADLTTSINNEATTRATKDTELQNRVSANETSIAAMSVAASAYKYYDTATISTTDALLIVANDATPGANEIKLQDVTPVAQGFTPAVGDYCVEVDSYSNAELQNVRIGYDGTTYTSAGQAVRAQINELQTDLAHLDDETNGVIANGVAVVDMEIETGAISTSTGADVTNSNKCRSKRYIRWDSSKTYILQNISGVTAYVFEYDESLAFVKYTSVQGFVALSISNPYFRVMFSIASIGGTKMLRCNYNISNFANNYYCLTGYEDITERIVDGAYIKTNLSLYESVDLTPISGAGFSYIIVDCKMGQKFTITGEGGEVGRLWAFVDESGVLVSVSKASVTASEIVLVAPCNGKLIYNSAKSVTKAISQECLYNVKGNLEDACEKIGIKLSNYYQLDFEKPADKNFIANVAYHIDAGHTYHVVNTSVSRAGTAINLYTRYTETGSNVETIATGLYETNVDGVYFTASESTDYLRIVANNSGSFKIYDTDAISAEIDAEKESRETCPIVKFDIDTELKDVSAINAKMDWTNKSKQGDVLEQIYKLYDELATANPDYITKVDAASDVSIEYPAYANGTDDVPAYKMYMYKFCDNNTHVGSHKKKLMILSAVHGNEIAAPFNLYVLMHEICNSFLTDSNLFKLRSAFDIYVIPCVNGYGMYKLTRGNGNQVNINRNFPIKGWEVYGESTKESATTNEYTGASAGSEFETQVIIAQANKITPDILIDHHNYSILDFAFYTDVCKTKFLPLTYQAMVDCSYAFKTGLPNWFGTGFDLLVHRDGAAPGSTELKIYGTSTNWADQNNIPFAATVEISECINYVNGVYDGVNRNNDFGDDTFSVGEFTLRNQVLHYCQWVLDNVN